MKKVLDCLKAAINENKSTELYEDMISDNILDVCYDSDFYSLPMNSIKRIIENSSDIDVKAAKTIISEMCMKHEDEAAQILNYINVPQATFEQCCVIISSLSTSPICVQLGKLIPNDKSVEVDYDYVLKIKEEEIKVLSEKVSKDNIPIPLDYEPNIYRACKNGNIESVKYLIYKGTDPERRDDDGNTPLIFATVNNQTDVMDFLLKNGAAIETPDDDGNTALIIAASGGKSSSLSFLVSQGADVNATNNYGFSALMYSAFTGQIGSIEYLIDHKANRNLVNREGKKAVDMASTDTVRYCLNNYGL